MGILSEEGNGEFFEEEEEREFEREVFLEKSREGVVEERWEKVGYGPFEVAWTALLEIFDEGFPVLGREGF